MTGLLNPVRSLAARAWAKRQRILADAPDALLEVAVLAFALWTVCCHATVVTKGTGTQLLITAALVFAIAAAFLIWRMRSPRSESAAEPARSSQALAELTATRSTSILGLLAAGAVLWHWHEKHDPWFFWFFGLLFLTAGSVVVLRQPPGAASHELVPAQRPWQAAVLWSLAVTGAVSTAFMNRPNSDDVLYVNLGVTLADHPEYVLYSRDTLHGKGMMPMVMYSVHSFELLAGALSWLTGVSTLRIIHLWFAPFAGLLTALAWARLCRLIEPRRWLWLVAIVVSYYLLDGTTERSVTGHSYMRLFQGKSVLLTVAVPLISAYAIDYVLRPSPKSWTLFAASVITGIGLSSTGLWLAMLVGLTGLFVPFTFRRSFFKTTAYGLIGLAYPIAMALWMRSTLHADGRSTDAPIMTSLAAAAKEAQGFRYELSSFGGRTLAHAYVACLLLAWPLARTALARRYVLAFTLGGFAVLANPFWVSFIAVNVTGVATYSRVLWYMPFTLAFALCFAAPLPASARSWKVLAGAAVTVLALRLFYSEMALATQFAMLDFPAKLKVNPEGYRISKYLARTLNDDQCSVLAPPAVSLVLPMVQRHPYAVMTKPKFFEGGGGRRFRLRRLIDRPSGSMAGRRRTNFIGALQDYNVRGVVLVEAAAQAQGMAHTLGLAGFHEGKRFDGYRVWLRPPWPVAAAP